MPTLGKGLHPASLFILGKHPCFHEDRAAVPTSSLVYYVKTLVVESHIGTHNQNYDSCVQVNRPPALISLKFIQGGFTFVALAATPTVHQTQSASLSAANISQQADLPKRMQAVFSEVHVYLPQGVSQSTAASPQYFGLAQQHRTSAAFWTRSSNLTRVLQLLVQP